MGNQLFLLQWCFIQYMQHFFALAFGAAFTRLNLFVVTVQWNIYLFFSEWTWKHPLISFLAKFNACKKIFFKQGILLKNEKRLQRYKRIQNTTYTLSQFSLCFIFIHLYPPIGSLYRYCITVMCHKSFVIDVHGKKFFKSPNFSFLL